MSTSISRRKPPVPPEVIAARLEIVAREYEARARYFRDRAAVVLEDAGIATFSDHPRAAS